MIVVIDYGIGNVRSVLNAFDYIGAQAVLSSDAAEIDKASGLVLPGVGAFGEGMRRLESRGLNELLISLVFKC
jgi:glutamine amidotransferase